MSALLQVRRLSVAYGKVEAIHGISLDVPEGSIVTVIGPNGAGKTTLLSAIIGLLPSRGEIEYASGATSLLSFEQRVAAGIVLVLEKREFFASMTVAENLELGAFARRRARDARATLDDGYVLETGEVALEGRAAELATNPRVVETYLGGSVAASA